MVKKVREVTEYYKIITDVWKFFRKFYENYDADASIKGVKDFEEDLKKSNSARLYEFGMQMIRIAWKEVGEIHELRKED